MKIRIIFIMIALIVCACSKNENIIDPNQFSFIIPLKVGNEWQYKMDYYDSLGRFDSSKQLTSKVLSVNDNWFLMENFGFFTETAVYKNIEDGFHIYNKVAGSSLEALLFKYPIKKGDKYYVNASTLEAASTDTLIKTSKGDFRCIEYHYYPNSRGFKYIGYRFFISPGIGIIRLVKYRYNDPNSYTLVDGLLSDYKFKN